MYEPLSPFTQTETDIRVSIRLTPNAAKDRFDKIVADAKGEGVLRIAVTATPEQGRANKALIRFLAKQWRIPKTSMTLIRGTKDRNKVLTIDGNTAERFANLQTWSRQFIREKKPNV